MAKKKPVAEECAVCRRSLTEGSIENRCHFCDAMLHGDWREIPAVKAYLDKSPDLRALGGPPDLPTLLQTVAVLSRVVEHLEAATEITDCNCETPGNPTGKGNPCGPCIVARACSDLRDFLEKIEHAAA